MCIRDSFCPAIVRLIQVRFPSLIDHIVPLKQAMDLAAIFARKKYLDKNILPDDVGIFYVTPCAAKIAAVKSPVGDDQSLSLIHIYVFRIARGD